MTSKDLIVVPAEAHNCLRWLAGALQAVADEGDLITMDGEQRTIGAILDDADKILGLIATQPAAGDPIQVEAVAVTREDEDGLYLDWVLEGGISALEAPGVVLLVAHGEVTDNQGSGEVYLFPPAAAHRDDAPGTVRVTADWLKTVHRDLDACQKVIWLAGCRPRVPGGFDPAYCEDAQERLREIDEQIARANGAEGSQHA